MFDVVCKHSVAAKANRYTTIKGLPGGQLGAELIKGIIEQIHFIGHLQLHGQLDDQMQYYITFHNWYMKLIGARPNYYGMKCMMLDVG